MRSRTLPQGEPAGLVVTIVCAILAASLACASVGCQTAAVDSSVRVFAFGSKSCRACQVEKPYREALGRRVSVNYIDVDADPDTADRLGVVQLPTYVVFKDGFEQFRSYSIHEVIRYLNGR